MTLIRRGAGPNPLQGFQVDLSCVHHVGTGLQRPESILAEPDGTLWAADARGGVVRIGADGTQTLVAQCVATGFDLENSLDNSLLHGTLPNGLAFASNGDLFISNFGTDRLERMSRTGATSIVLDSLDGKPLGKVNFVLRDRKDRLWITISTRVNPWSDAINANLADGYIVLLDERGPRIVADGFHFTNEIKFDATEEWLYVAETTAKRVTRIRCAADGTLTDREVFGPSHLGDGLIDGITFDAYGNLWATMIFADRLIAITPGGEVLELFCDGDRVATSEFESAFASGETVPFDIILRCGGSLCPWLASVTFGGSDLSTVYLGGLRSTTIPSFSTPVAGLPLTHWQSP